VSQYYYLMAQLPGILPGAPPAVSFTQFRELAGRFLSRKDLSALSALSLEPPRDDWNCASSFLQNWFERERALRFSLAQIRAARLKRDKAVSSAEEEEAQRNYGIAQVARNALAIDNPLEAERYLDSVRLAWVMKLGQGHFFDSDAVFAYGLMLLLREREDSLSVSAGRASYTTIYDQILGEEA